MAPAGEEAGKELHGPDAWPRQALFLFPSDSLVTFRSSPRGDPINGVGVSPHILEADPNRQLELAVEKAGGAVPALSRPMPSVPGGLNP